jgi:hypothetical protein
MMVLIKYCSESDVKATPKVPQRGLARRCGVGIWPPIPISARFCRGAALACEETPHAHKHIEAHAYFIIAAPLVLREAFKHPTCQNDYSAHTRECGKRLKPKERGGFPNKGT